MTWVEPISLRGPRGRVEPLSQDHCEGLTEAVKDGELWKIWYTSIPRAEDMGKEIDRRLGLQAAGSMLPWTVFDADGKIAGMTTYMNVDAPNRRGENSSNRDGQGRAGQPPQHHGKILFFPPAVQKNPFIPGGIPHPFFYLPRPRRSQPAGGPLDGRL